jgi:hypothetical protein
MSKRRVDVVEEMVHTLFGEVFEVFFSEDKRKYKIQYRPHEDPVDPTDPCITFHFNEDLSNLYIDNLRKRIKDDPRSGQAILQLIDKLAESIPECKTISVEDKLNMYKCSYAFNLATITILVNGISWYNHMGYRQASYDADKAYNNEIRNMTVKAALTKLLTCPENKGRFPELTKYKTELEKALELDPQLTRESTLTNYIRAIYTEIASYSDDENKCNAFKRHHSQLFAYIINAFGHLLQYDGLLLIKQVNHEDEAAAEAHNNPPPSSIAGRCRYSRPVATAAADAEPITGSSSPSVLGDDKYMARYAAKECGNDHNRGEGGTWQVYDGSQYSAVSAAEPVCSQQQQQSFGSLLQRTMEGPEAMMGSYGGAIKSRKPTRRTNRRTRRRTSRRTNRRTSRKNKRNYVRRTTSNGVKK